MKIDLVLYSEKEGQKEKFGYGINEGEKLFNQSNLKVIDYFEIYMIVKEDIKLTTKVLKKIKENTEVAK